MDSSEILSQAMEHIPALLVIWLSIYAAYWLLGIAKWPAAPWRDRFLDRWGSLDIVSLGGFRFGSLALISLVSLFLELLLIRWISSEIRVFAYFKSLVLIATFLGFGLGSYLTRRKIHLAYTLVPLLAMVVLVELPWDPVRRMIVNLSSFIGWFSDVHIFGRAHFEGNFFWGAASAAMAISVVIPLFGLIAITLVPLGQLVGWYLENSTNGVFAYSVNVLASVVGILFFTALGFLSTPPVVWFIILGLGLLLFFRRLPGVRKTIALTFLAIPILFGIGTQKTQWFGEQSWKGSSEAEFQLEAGQSETHWSPYQKLTIIPLKRGDETVRYILNTNDSWYQQILDLSDKAVADYPEFFEEIPVQYHQYNLPYQFYPDPPKVLIAGAGMGNDVASALRNGAEHVTAVEIDPLIHDLGKQLHFEDPYHSERVDVVVDDARSYVQNATEKFDLVVFSILDSQTTSSHYTNIRLDNFVYTLESMEATKQLLKPDGLFVMSFSSERPWFTQRLRDIVTQAFGKTPLMVQSNVSFFVVGPGSRVETVLSANSDLATFVDTHSEIELEGNEIITDDWPYLYLRRRGIPVIVWLLSIGLIGVTWLTLNRLKASGEGIHWHFFFLGAAFMLLEVQIISKTALLFGTTWLVNALVISTLLIFILLANLVAYLVPRFPREVAYIGLFVTLVLGYLIPIEAVFHESLLIRGILALALFCSPVFFAGLIFISSFKRFGFQAEAFGSNLFGSMVGGLLESLSFWIGIKALLIIAGLLYVLSWMTIGTAASPVSKLSRMPFSLKRQV